MHFPRCQLVSVWHLLGKIQIEYEESTYATRWTLEPSSVPTHESHMSVLVPKLDLWIFWIFFKMSSSSWWVRTFYVGMSVQVMGVSFPSPSDRVACELLRSMTTGCRLTHQRLANWGIVSFGEIVSRQYDMAYDTRPHEWSYQPWILAKKNIRRKKICRPDLGCHLDAWIICIINKRKIGESRRCSLCWFN